MGNIQEITIENRAYYFFDYMINIKKFDSNLLKKTKIHAKMLIFITLDISQREVLIM